MKNKEMIVIFYRYVIAFFVDLISFIATHLTLNLFFKNYLASLILSISIYSIYLLIVRKDLRLILPVCLAFFIFTLTVPIMNDRSATVFIMKNIHQFPDIREMQIRERLNVGYFKGDYFLKSRLREELLAGNIEEINSGYRTTLKGNLLVDFYNKMDFFYGKNNENSNN